MTAPATPAKPASSRVQVHLPADLEPIYSNLALITNSPSEIVIDFAQIMPQVAQARVRARLVLTPLNAKLVLRALTDHLARFEAQFGQITIPESASLADHLFRPPAGETPPADRASHPEGEGS